MITIEVTVTPDDNEAVTKVMDILSRVATGLAFDGNEVDINIRHWEAIPAKEEEET